MVNACKNQNLKNINTNISAKSLKRESAEKSCLTVILLGLMLSFALGSVETINPHPDQTKEGIPVPLLQKQVKFDARKTTNDEWSDASETRLFLNCWGGCAHAPKERQQRTNMTVWLKHDGTWLYLLYQIYWAAKVGNDDLGSVCYSWRNDSSLPFQYADCGGVGPALGYPQPYDNWMERKSNKNYWHNDEEVGGKIDVEGWARYDGTNYWYEFRKRLNSGDGHDFNLTVGRAYPNAVDVDGSFEFAFQYTTNYNEGHSASVKINLLPIALVSMTATRSSFTFVTTSKSISTTSVTSAQSTSQPTFLVTMPLEPYMLAGLVAVVVLSSVVVVLRRRRAITETALAGARPESRTTPSTPSAVEQRGVLAGIKPAAAIPIEKPMPIVESPPEREAEVIISTGYADLDTSLSGGIPERYAVLFASPSYDERDLLLRKIIETNLTAENPTFFISGDARKAEDLLRRYSENFFVFCPHADKIATPSSNLHKIGGVENLSDFNISLTMAIRGIPVKQSVRRIMIIDTLSDVLLHHRLLTTRKWLSDFLTRRKAEGFTIFATFNPLIAPREEVQTILDSFDGVIEIYEKELKERSKRFLLIKKMYGRRYSENELMLEKDKLF